MQPNTPMVIALIKRLFRLDQKMASALMPFGHESPLHYVGGYITDSGKSEAQEEYERDTDGWTILD